MQREWTKEEKEKYLRQEIETQERQERQSGAWWVFYNSAAGDHYITRSRPISNQEGHYRLVDEGHGDSELKKALDRLAGPQRWAGFEDRPAGKRFVEQVDNLSGNYKGSGRHPFSFVQYFFSEEEAREWEDPAPPPPPR